MRKQMGGPYSDLQPGDVIVSHGGNVAVIWEREVPDVPTRVVGFCHWNANPDTDAHVDLPREWLGEVVTCILGKDELPKDVKAVAERWAVPVENDVCVLARFVKSRWPEAFHV